MPRSRRDREWLVLFSQIELGRFLEMGDRLLDRPILAHRPELRTIRHVEIIPAMDGGAQRNDGHSVIGVLLRRRSAVSGARASGP
jgi:hypothetical protein